MIIPTSTEWTKRLYHFIESRWVLPRKFRKVHVHGVELKPDHSVLLLQNHMSWWDGFLGSHLCYEHFHKSFHVMVQEEQLRKFPFFRYKGAFSVKKNSREAFDSLAYAAELLNESRNLVLIFPQGRLQSMHVPDIAFEQGVFRLLQQIQGPCQVIYCSSVIEYLESFKPSIHLHLMDCGVASELDMEKLPEQVSAFHREALQKQVRK
ncbi:MAG: lysophospholipid acyltransferase family protein [Cytophagales bacterium]|nr:lysophospholipid acyltransferase family protein [Cytophagales bacterium]